MTPRIQPLEYHHHQHDEERPQEYEDITLQSYEKRWSDESVRTAVRLWKLSAAETKQLRELQVCLRDLDHWKNNPQDVVRYLRGPGPKNEVEGKIREMIQWRIDYGADRLLEEYRPPRALLYYIPSAVLKGYDKEGDPIYLERGGVMDGVGLQRYSRDDIVKHVCWLREIATRNPIWLSDYQRRTGRQPTQVTIIYDLKGMNSSCLKGGVIPMFRDIVKINQQRYCGLAKRIILLRAPSVFNFLWSVAKHFFPPEGVKLMVFTGPSNYLSVLDKYIDRDVLPPCICKEGRGSAIDCMPQNFEGGILPLNAEATIPDEPWINNLMNTAKTMRQHQRANRESYRESAKDSATQAASANMPPVCLSDFKNVQVLTQPQWQEEFETVLVR